MVQEHVEPVENPVGTSEMSAPDRKPDQCGLIESTDGTRIYYETVGQGPTLLMCYGLLCRTAHWRHQVAHFSKRFQVVLLDYRGHHRSEAPENENNLTVDWCARDAKAVLDHLGVERYVAFGHSLGVPVVASLAGFDSKRLTASVFICGAAHNPFEQMFFTDRLDGVIARLIDLSEMAPSVLGHLWPTLTSPNPINLFLVSQLGFNPISAESRDVRSYVEGVSQTPIRVFARLLQDYRRVDRRSLLTQIAAPTLIFAGRDDCVTPMSVQEEMAKLIPKSELVRVAHGSHNPHVDFPERINRKIEEFLDRQSP